jgi:hypothetical protein
VDYRRHSPPYCSQLPVACELFCGDRHLAAPSESVFVRWYQQSKHATTEHLGRRGLAEDPHYKIVV